MLREEIIKHIGIDDEYFYYLKFNRRAFRRVEIKKKKSGKRTLMIPCKKLKDAQRYILSKYDSLLENNKFLSKQYAYMKHKNSVIYAKKHIGKKYIIKLDVENYFDKITFPRVLGVLKKNMNYDDAVLISQLACYRNNQGKHISIAQGSPLSPMISNLVSSSIEKYFDKFFSKYIDVEYTRYADDITISTDNRDIFDGIYLNYEKIANGMEKIGFTLNHKKTRFISKGKKLVGGIKINIKPNLDRKYVDKIVLNLHYANKDFELTKNRYIEIYGNKKKAKNDDLFFRNSLIGKINYLCLVKGANDNKVKKIKQMFNTIKEFDYIFDLRSDIEKSVFVLEFLCLDDKGEETLHNGTCFYLKNKGIVTCYHNLYSYTSSINYSFNIKLFYKDKKNQITELDTGIDTTRIKKADMYCYENDILISDKNDFVFISNEYLKRKNRKYEDFLMCAKGLNLASFEEISSLKDKLDQEIKVYGYSHYRNEKSTPSQSSIKIVNYDLGLHDICLATKLGEGASGGPMIIDNKVYGIYNKGTSVDFDAKGKDLIELSRFLYTNNK